MLTDVFIKNLALIREAEINFRPGLNILTGETGSGKSIIINSINIALGDKASKNLIRHGSDSGLIELTFVTEREDILKILDDNGISRNGCQIVITRKILPSSSVARINGETVTLDVIRQITQGLVDIHGQHDHQSLLDPLRHLDIIDLFGAEKVSALKSDVRDAYEEYKSLRKDLLKYSLDKDAYEREVSLLRHEVNEIEAAKLSPGEDAALEARYRQMSDWSRISGALSRALADIKGEDSGAYYLLNDAEGRLNEALEADPDNKDIMAILSTLKYLESVAEDAGRDLESYLSSRSFDQAEYDGIRNRLDNINHLKERYGRTIEDVIEYGQKASLKLEWYNNYDNEKKAVLGRLESARERLSSAAHRLSDARKEAADILAPMITDSLKDLNFLDVDFVIEFSKNSKISVNGFDRAEFLISVNPGEVPRPLAKIASGGELSRVMLAIKSSIARRDDISTLIFDEIDTGISGKTAQMVSVKLAELSRDHQVICITHLPQIAAMADAHFAISKEVEDGSTISGTVELDEESSVHEIARLLSGDHVTETSLKNAAELKAESSSYKMKDNKNKI